MAYRDADVIATLLTAEQGRVSALARGARKSSRRFGGGLQPCCRLHVELGASRSGLGRLAQSRIAEGFDRILGDLRKMTMAGRAMEVVRSVTVENEPDRRVFDTTLQFLRALDSAPAAWPSLLSAFALRLLALGGFTPELRGCASCGKPCPASRPAYFDALRGGIVCRSCGGGALLITSETRRRIANCLEADWVPEAGWAPGDNDAVDELIVRFTGAHLGKPLRLEGSDEAIRQAVERAHRENPGSE